MSESKITVNTEFTRKRPAPVEIPGSENTPTPAGSPPTLVRCVTDIPAARKLTLRSRVYTEEERKELVAIFEKRLSDLKSRPLTKARSRRVSLEAVSPVYVIADFSDDSDMEREAESECN